MSVIAPNAIRKDTEWLPLFVARDDLFAALGSFIALAKGI
jgi:hypothetical protein